EDIPNYPAAQGQEDGDYELVKDTINYEMNRINREIVEAPFKVRDLGVQVVIDSVVGMEDEELQLLSAQEQNAVEDGVASILDSVITTSIDKEYGEIETDEKISIVFQEFSQQDQRFDQLTTTRSIPIWAYIVGGILLAIIILLIILLLRRKNENIGVEADTPLVTNSLIEEDIPDLVTQPKSESEIQREQLEKMAGENPDDFAKLLRSWISDD
ncbi:MAG TPA: flagellar M-ring protein FliF C-terminal domain-containing protein, partial [Pseudogracilibacillus sp.]|nr:flagellar M-ring protein FliF C-terminal domain-containing protein [Pseudogracilibacillus sp.]